MSQPIQVQKLYPIILFTIAFMLGKRSRMQNYKKYPFHIKGCFQEKKDIFRRINH